MRRREFSSLNYIDFPARVRNVDLCEKSALAHRVEEERVDAECLGKRRVAQKRICQSSK